MDPELIAALPQLGTTGFAIWVMFMMYKLADARFQEKDEALQVQVEKHEDTMKEHQTYMRGVHQSSMKQLDHASKVIEDNIKAYERVIRHLDGTK